MLLSVSSFGYADSLQRFINIHKEKEGARYMVFNRDSHFNDVPKNAFTPFSLKLRSGTLKVLGIEEMVILQVGCGYHDTIKAFHFLQDDVL